MEKVSFSQLLLLLGETILVLGETMWAKLVMGKTRYIPSELSEVRVIEGKIM